MGAEFICRVWWASWVLRVSRTFFDFRVAPIRYFRGGGGSRRCSRGRRWNCALLRLLPVRFLDCCRLMSNFGLNGCIPWLQNTDDAFCFICKEETESMTHFLLDCFYFRNNFDSLWNKLKLKIAQSNQTDGVYICNFITNLDRNNKVLLLLGGLPLPLDSKTNIQINRFISTAVGKISKLRQKRYNGGTMAS